MLMGLFSRIFGKKKTKTEKDFLIDIPKEDSFVAFNEEPIKTNNKTQEKKKASSRIEKTVSLDEDFDADKISTDKESKSVEIKGYGGAFEIKKSKDGRYVFNLFAANHVIVATSQIYSSSQSAMVGIKSVISNAEKANVEDQTLKSFQPQPYPKWELYIDKAGQYRFRLCASNGSCVCHSQGYTQKSTCKKGIESIIRTVKTAKIDKSYLNKN